MKQSGNGYKLSKFVQKIFADFIVDIRFFVQLADGRWGHFASPQRLRDILCSAHRDTRQVHFDESFLHAAFKPAIPFYNAVSKETPFRRGTWSVTSPEVVVRFRL